MSISWYMCVTSETTLVNNNIVVGGINECGFLRHEVSGVSRQRQIVPEFCGDVAQPSVFRRLGVGVKLLDTFRGSLLSCVVFGLVVATSRAYAK